MLGEWDDDDNTNPLLSLQIPNLAQIYLVGFYEEREFALYVSAISNELKVPVRLLINLSSSFISFNSSISGSLCSSDLSFLILFWFLYIRYLREDKPHGSAGGLYHFRNLIMEDSPVSLQGSYYIESCFCETVLWTKCFFLHLSSCIYFLAVSYLPA